MSDPIRVDWGPDDLDRLLSEAEARGAAAHLARIDALLAEIDTLRRLTRAGLMPDPVVAFDIIGAPAPQGSKSFKGMSRSGHAILTESSKHVAPWRQTVAATTHEHLIDPTTGRLQTGFPLDEALTVAMIFTLPKPASNPKTRRTWPVKYPDLSKLARSTEDALKDGGLWKDDARAVRYHPLAKTYPREDPDALDVPGVRIRVWRTADLAAAATAHALAAPVETADLTLFG